MKQRHFEFNRERVFICTYEKYFSFAYDDLRGPTVCNVDAGLESPGFNFRWD